MFAPSPRVVRARPYLIAAVALLLIAVILGGRSLMAGRETAQAPAQPAQRQAAAAVVQTAPSVSGPIRATFTYAGSVSAADQVSLVPRTSGIVRSINVQVGQAVRQGEILATLDPGSLTDQV